MRLEMRELMMGLALVGTGELYAARLQRLAGAVHALEKRVFSEEFLAKMSPGSLMELYKLAVDETNKSAKYMAGILTTIDMDTIRNRLVELGTKPDDRVQAQAAKLAVIRASSWREGTRTHKT